MTHLNNSHNSIILLFVCFVINLNRKLNTDFVLFQSFCFTHTKSAPRPFTYFSGVGRCYSAPKIIIISNIKLFTLNLSSFYLLQACLLSCCVVKSKSLHCITWHTIRCFSLSQLWQKIPLSTVNNVAYLLFYQILGTNIHLTTNVAKKRGQSKRLATVSISIQITSQPGNIIVVRSSYSFLLVMGRCPLI